MGEADINRHVFPLTSLQIGDLQSYLSDLSIFLAYESKKLYILVDNRPWLRFKSRPAHLWQFMVTKSRLSPFAITKARRKTKEGKKARPKADNSERKKFKKWFSLINSATLSQKRVFHPVKKLQNSFFFKNGLHRTLYGFIVFEVDWDNVRGINYVNELQTDTSLAIETKVIRRWEFDSIPQAVRCVPLWFSGSPVERWVLQEHLDSIVEEVFYDAETEFPVDDTSDIFDGFLSADDKSPQFASDSCSGSPSSLNKESKKSLPSTPPLKRRRVNKSIGSGAEAGFPLEEEIYESEGSSNDSNTRCASDTDNGVDGFQYKDILILFRFNDRDLPFALRRIIMSDLRLLTLLEAGLPSWVLFLQSYPGFCHIYRPWMCPLARALYVIISVITVLIGFYDLYKNVPVLKATAARLCGPLIDWIETWEMVSRIQYLGTMLFLQNVQKALKWFLTMSRTTGSFLSILTQPFVEPLLDIFEFLLPLWNLCSGLVGSCFSVVWFAIGSSCSIVADLIEFLLQPLWFLLSAIWSIGTSILCPAFWMLWEIFYLPIRVVLGLSNTVAFVWNSVHSSLLELWQSLSSISRLASASNAAVSVTTSTYEVSKWRSLWNDLFSQVFRALRSILNGFVAFFTACNRHRLSIYNHLQRLLDPSWRSRHADYGHCGSSKSPTRSPPPERRKDHLKQTRGPFLG